MRCSCLGQKCPNLGTVTGSTQHVNMIFENAPWGESHGFSQNTLGAAPLYATVANSLLARDVLVIGSGAGFTPKVFLENVPSIRNLSLVDAFLAETGNGSPFDIPTEDLDYPNIIKNRAKLEIYKVMSRPFLELAIAKKNNFDLIFIDGDHSIEGFRSDLELSLKCLRRGGAILFHDTKIQHIQVIADELLHRKWVNFEIGAGFGLYTRDGIGSLRMDNTSLNSNEIEGLHQKSMEQRWDYSASVEFQQRNDTVTQMLSKYLLPSEILSVLEVGGNPNPLLPKILELIRFDQAVTVEPYISPVARDIFENLKLQGVEIATSLGYIADKQMDLVIVLGVDLSLSKDFNQLERDALQIKNSFECARLVVTETPNYLPSKWLEKFLTGNLILIESKTVFIEADNKFSISKEIQTREISIWKVPKQQDLSLKSSRDSHFEIVKYARWHAMENTPRELLLFGQTGYEVQQTFNSWQVETDPTGNSFVWLKSDQSLIFPVGKKELIIHFYQGPKPILRHSLFLTSEVHDTYLAIRRRTGFRRLHFSINSWVPSSVDATSSDHRNLTIAANGFEFN